MEISIYIDSLTDCLRHRESGVQYDTEYRLVQKNISKQNAAELKHTGWLFDWSIPHQNGYEVYELLLKGCDEVQGRIALKHIRNQYYTHVDIVETAPFNVGQNGTYIGVGAHLFAIACKLSWEAGNEGYVQFTAKTNLIEHYQETLNAHLIDKQTMYIDSYNSANLVKKYFTEGI